MRPRQRLRIALRSRATSFVAWCVRFYDRMKTSVSFEFALNCLKQTVGAAAAALHNRCIAKCTPSVFLFSVRSAPHIVWLRSIAPSETYVVNSQVQRIKHAYLSHKSRRLTSRHRKAVGKRRPAYDTLSGFRKPRRLTRRQRAAAVPAWQPAAQPARGAPPH